MVDSTALVTRVKGNMALLHTEQVDIGPPSKDQVLVKVVAVAQNRTDGQFPN